MSKHLVLYGHHLVEDPLLDVEAKYYWPKRLRFWKWFKHHTMGRPILVPRRHTDVTDLLTECLMLEEQSDPPTEDKTKGGV